VQAAARGAAGMATLHEAGAWRRGTDSTGTAAAAAAAAAASLAATRLSLTPGGHMCRFRVSL
jgi:hypothetical protein